MHVQAVEYQNAIEDEYLRRHRELMDKKHKARQESFRKKCFFDSYGMWKDAERVRREDEKWEAKVNQTLQGE